MVHDRGRIRSATETASVRQLTNRTPRVPVAHTPLEIMCQPMSRLSLLPLLFPDNRKMNHSIIEDIFPQSATLPLIPPT
ncbi:hypothetical protein KC341_g74 [Hortaea werneckii]|nr:hypothetical protein KC341_g74 [Hortaea werneckii]